MRFCHHTGYGNVYTFSISETEDKEIPSRTSGAVKARKSCWVTYSSVNEMLPEGMSRRDQGEMMKPMAVGSGKGNRQFNHWRYDQEQKQEHKHNKFALPLFKNPAMVIQAHTNILSTVSSKQIQPECSNCRHIQPQWMYLVKVLAFMQTKDDSSKQKHM